MSSTVKFSAVSCSCDAGDLALMPPDSRQSAYLRASTISALMEQHQGTNTCRIIKISNELISELLSDNYIQVINILF